MENVLYVAKKILNIAVKVLTWLLIVFTVFMMVFTVVSVTTLDKNDRSIFGFKFYIVRTDSMSLSEKNKDMDVHFNAGDIILIKNLDDTRNLQAGDIIVINGIVGVAKLPIKAGVLGSIALSGVFDVTKSAMSDMEKQASLHGDILIFSELRYPCNECNEILHLFL